MSQKGKKAKLNIERITVIQKLIICRIASCGRTSVSEICQLTRTSEIIEQIRSSVNREFNEYKFDLSDRAVKAFTRDASAGRSLITGINLKSQLRSDRKKSPLGSINGGNGSLTTRGKSRRTWAINFLRLPAVLHVPPKIYHDTISFLPLYSEIPSINPAKIPFRAARYRIE